jgi:hypothetical protein
MTKPHPKSTKEIKDWFIPGKLYMPTTTCLAWITNSKSTISMFSKVAYYPHYHPLLYLSITLETKTNFQLNFMDNMNPIWIYYNSENTKEFLQPWIRGMIELS